MSDFKDDDFDLSRDFRRATLFNKIDPVKTADEAWHAASKVAEHMGALEGRRSIVGVSEIGTSPENLRYHVDVLVEDPLAEKDAPPEYVDGIYVAISRVNSLDSWLGSKNNPQAPKP